MHRVAIPQIFENMEEATIGAWLRREGDEIRSGDALCELITEKTTLDLKSEAEGILRRIVAPEKSVVPVNFVIALIGEADEPLPDADAENATLREMKMPPPEPGAPNLSVPALEVAPLVAAAPTISNAGSRIRATPAARRAAKDAGIDIETVAAANPGKVLSEEDVKIFAAR